MPFVFSATTTLVVPDRFFFLLTNIVKRPFAYPKISVCKDTKYCLSINYKMDIFWVTKSGHLPLCYKIILAFPPYKCFRTFAVWKHFSIYPSQSRGRTCPTRDTSFSSANLPPTSLWRKSKRCACANGQTSSFVAVCTAAFTSSNTASSKPRWLCISSSAPSPQ